VTIGRPIANVQVYVLDGRLGLCPLGVAGELCIGGAGLATGYLNQEALTKEKFVDNPFGAGKLYRSGDLGRWLPDGTLEYLGRKDEQVKVRGYRIELGEIEQVLQQSEWVKQAVVTVTADHNGNKQLVGYVVPQGEFDREALGRYLLSRLPEYMVPSLLVPIGQVPLTANGKVDRNALPRVDASQPGAGPAIRSPDHRDPAGFGRGLAAVAGRGAGRHPRQFLRTGWSFHPHGAVVEPLAEAELPDAA
jgi:acyl-CoA synthetase (AMP-forming)/AMP-acid ligase II